MGKNNWYNNDSGYRKDYYDDDGNDLRGGNDEYYDSWCDRCARYTEHDGCTGRCTRGCKC